MSTAFDWRPVDTTRQRLDLLGLPLEVAATLPGANDVHKYREPALDRYVVGKRMMAKFGRPLVEALREPQLQNRLRHDHLVPVIDVCDVLDTRVHPPRRIDGEFTPWYPEGSVADALSNGFRPDVRKALDIGRAAALGLSELQREGYVHRDFKSPNLFLTGDAHVARVGDLGEAHPIDPDGTAPGLDSPTPWIAPEQVARDTCTVKSDLFGLGVVLVELLRGGFDLTGWDRDSAHQRMSRGQTPLARARMEPPPWAPPRVRALVRSLTSADPAARRPATATAVSDILATTPAVGWSPCSPERWEGTARSDGRTYAVTVRHLPRLGEWETRVERHGPSGWRALHSSRAPSRERALAGTFDRALALAG